MSSGATGQRHELQRPIAIYYEHPDWFRPLFQRLDESGVAWKKIDARNHQYDAASTEEEFSLTEALRAAVDENRLYFGIDSTALVQEAFTPRDGVITRVEVLGGKYLYAIKIHTTGESFNLCPADICQSTKGEELTRIACPADAPRTGMTVEGYEPPARVIEDAERIMALAGVEVGGIEYATDDRTGRQLYYDVNALSNFVADPVRVIGFDPYTRLADFLIQEAIRHEALVQEAGGEENTIASGARR